MYSSIFFIWNTASRRDPPHTALHTQLSTSLLQYCTEQLVHICTLRTWRKAITRSVLILKLGETLFSFPGKSHPRNSWGQSSHCPLLPTLPEVAPCHGGGHAASLPAVSHIPAFNEVLSKKFLHMSTESLLHLLIFRACCNLQCLVKTNRNIDCALPPRAQSVRGEFI